MKKVAIISLGCDKNRVDTENMLYYLTQEGYSITDDFDNAEIIIINTCAFIESARVEAIDNILSSIKYKDKKCEKVIVSGCLSQKYSGELDKELPEVDAFIGTNNYQDIGSIISNLYDNNRIINVISSDKTDVANRVVSTPQHYAYLKISEGCDNKCTFCNIPSIRGKYTSRTIESLVSEAKSLVQKGASELILVAQDVTRYGIDIYGEYKLIELLKRLVETDVNKIRLMYCYPELVTAELVDLIASNDKIAKYIDIPLQHVSDKILKRMNRKSTKSSILDMVKMIRSKSSDIAIRTTFMVGFPGEGDKEFNELIEFVQQYKLDHIGIFCFSNEEDAPSYNLDCHVDTEVAKDRESQLAEAHFDNVTTKNTAMIGKCVQVVYEDIDYDRNLFAGRTQQNAPNIDAQVYFSANFVDVGCTYDVKIIGYDGYDLIGEKL